MGRPVFEVTEKKRSTVRSLAGLGFRQEEIGNALGISTKTLRKHFAAQLEVSSMKANAKVMATLFGMATSGGNTAASIFWAKTRCGLKDGMVAKRAAERAEETSVLLPNFAVRLS